MSKSEGKKIAIKFTEDLVGDVSGNESAFTISGKEYKYVQGLDFNSELIDKEYPVVNLERYGTPPIWQMEGKIELESIGEIEATPIWETRVFTTGNPATGTRGFRFSPMQNCNVIILEILATETISTIHLWDFLDNSLIVSKTFSTTPNIWNEIRLDEPISLVEGNDYILSANYTFGNNYYRNANPMQSEFNNITYKGFFNSTTHNVLPTVSNTWGNAVNLIIEIGELAFEEEKTYTTENISLNGEYRINWESEVPQESSIKIETYNGEVWNEINNGGLINVVGDLQIRVTLSTEDTNITPILNDLWLEESTAPQDRILLTFGDKNTERFNSVVGDLTISYDAQIGDLSGSGGRVDDFTVNCTPTDLVATPNPGVTEIITVAPVEIIGTLNKIDILTAYATETITVAPVEVTGVLTDIGEINP